MAAVWSRTLYRLRPGVDAQRMYGGVEGEGSLCTDTCMCYLKVQCELIDCTRFSTLAKLLRVTAQVLRAVEKFCKKKRERTNSYHRTDIRSRVTLDEGCSALDDSGT